MALSFEDTKNLLEKYEIPLVKGKVISSCDEAVAFAKESGFPLVLKISSPKILHKSDISGVILNIQNKESLSLAFDKINKLAKTKKTQILIQKQKQGIEIIIGAKRDPVFGPIIMFGSGGIFVELFKDVSFRLAPITKKEAGQMIQETKGYKLLSGFRGNEKANLEKIKDILVSASQLITKENIKEIDLNPVIANSKETLIVDAKILK